MTYIRGIILIALVWFFAGCSAIAPRVYNGDSHHPEKIAVLYLMSLSRVDGDPLQASSFISKVIDQNGKALPITGGRLELKPGKYVVYANWSKLIKDDSYWIVGGGVPTPVSNGKFMKSNKPYKITFIAKKGMTYMIDIEATMQNKERLPAKLCIIEDKHNALGAEGPRLNANIRYASPQAKVVACGK